MATLAQRPVSGADHRFFMTAAILMAIVIAAGFSVHLAAGRSSFDAPLPVHLHAVLFFGWVVFYLVQNGLIATGSVALHRRLGWFGAALATVVVVIGITTTVASVQRGTNPFFFQPSYFLFMNSMMVTGFGALLAAGIVLRRQTAWHRRLIFCGMAILTGPGFGRLIPLPLLMPYAGWAVFIAVMLFPLAGIIADWRRTGQVHPAWWWGAGVITAIQLAIAPIAFSSAGLALHDRLVSGTAGAERSGTEFPAPPLMP